MHMHQPRHVCTSGAGGQSRDDREGSHERERKRQKEDATEAKAEEAAATEPKAGVILEVILQPLQLDQAAKAYGLKRYSMSRKLDGTSQLVTWAGLGYVTRHGGNDFLTPCHLQ